VTSRGPLLLTRVAAASDVGDKSMVGRHDSKRKQVRSRSLSLRNKYWLFAVCARLLLLCYYCCGL